MKEEVHAGLATCRGGGLGWIGLDCVGLDWVGLGGVGRCRTHTHTLMLSSDNMC